MADRCKTIQLPLFPGYVFCCFDQDQRRAVIATSGVIDVLRIGSQPAAIDAAEMDALQRIATSPLLTEPYSGLFAGERVKLTEGPLKGLSGTLIGLRSAFRLVISVELPNRSVLVEIDRDWVVAERFRASSYSRALTKAVSDSGAGA